MPEPAALSAPSATEAAVRPARDPWTALTPRERQVVDLLVQGLTARAIGRALGISPRTVAKHLEHAYVKLGHHDRLGVLRLHLGS